jgi:hypothetical protein
MAMLKFACLLLVALNLTLAAQTAREQPAQQSRDEQELTRLVQEECEGVLENHAAALDRIWADEFVMLTSDGVTTPKARARAYLLTALPEKIAGLCEIKDLKIKINGRKATTEGRMSLRAMDLQLDIVPLDFKFSQKLVWRDRRWQATYLVFSRDKP